MIDHISALKEAVQLRENVRHKVMYVWKVSCVGEVNWHLAWLLNCNNPFLLFPEKVEDNVLRGLRNLDGPHGYTYYKVLLAKRNGE